MSLIRPLLPALALPLVFSIPANGLGPELLVGGDFESLHAKSALPEGWATAFIPDTKKHVKFAAVEGSGRDEGHAASITVLDTHPADKKVAYNWHRKIEGLEPGKLYVMDGWVRSEDLASTAFAMLQFWGPEGRMLGGARCEDRFPILGTQDWTHMATIFRVPEGMDHARIRIGMSTQTEKEGTVWFDDFSVRELE
ncbi:MAG: hypothetical protein ACPG31_13130 [Planctomycetota bacterium]